MSKSQGLTVAQVKERGRLERPAPLPVTKSAKPKDIVLEEGDVYNVKLRSGETIQIVATKDSNVIQHGERETLFHEKLNEGEWNLTWPPMPEESNMMMEALFGGDEASEERLEKALAGR